MNSAASSKRSGFRGARTNSALGCSPCTTPKAINASGSSVATTLPATTIGERPCRRASVSSQVESGVAAGSSMSYLRLPLTETRSAGGARGRGGGGVFFLFSSATALGGRAQGANAFSVFLALHQEPGRVPQSAAQEGPKEKAKFGEVALIARE